MYTLINSWTAFSSSPACCIWCLTWVLKWFSSRKASRLLIDLWIESDCSNNSVQYTSFSMALIRPSSCPRIIFARCMALFLSFWSNMGIAYTPIPYLSSSGLWITKFPRKTDRGLPSLTLNLLNQPQHIYAIAYMCKINNLDVGRPSSSWVRTPLAHF